MLPLRVTEAVFYPYFIAFLLLSVIALVIKRITLFTNRRNTATKLEVLYCLNGTPLNYILPDNANYDMVLWQQILAGDFIDYIFDKPDYIHELVHSQDLCLILKNMKEE